MSFTAAARYTTLNIVGSNLGHLSAFILCFVLAGSGLNDRLIRPGVLRTVYKINNFGILNGNSPQSLIRKR
jgi:hypothetical protein